MYIHGIIIIEDNVLVQSFDLVTVPLKITKSPVVSCFMCIANYIVHYIIPVACEAIPVEHDTGNLLLNGTVHVHVHVHVHAQLVIIK